VTSGAVAHDDLVLAAKGGGVMFLGRLFAWGSRFFLAVILARALGAQEYGLYSLALAAATIVSSVGILGLDAALVRFIAVFASRGDARSLIGTMQLALSLPALVAIVLGLGVVVLADPIASGVFDDAELAPVLRLAGLLIPALVTNALLAAVLQGLRLLHNAVMAEQFAQQILRFVFIAGFLLIGLSAFLAMLASTLAAIGVTLLLAVMVYRSVPKGAPGDRPVRETRAIFNFSIPVWLSNVVTTLGHNVQTTVLGALATSAAVGVFSIAGQVTLLGTMFHTAVVSASMPLFAALQDRRDRRAVEHLYRTTSKWTLGANLPLFLILLTFPAEILGLFGPDFREGTAALSVMAWGGLVNAGTGTSGALLDMSGHTRLKLLNSTLAVGSGIGLSLLLIPGLGILGAAVASAASIILVNLLRLVEVAVLVRVTPYDRSWLKPIAAGGVAVAAAVAVTSMLGLSSVMRVVVGAPAVIGVYAGMILLLGLTEDDRMILSRAWRRFRRLGRGDRRGPGSSTKSESQATVGTGSS
jgi:O-antigen/teichoic acid export membrane protein